MAFPTTCTIPKKVEQMPITHDYVAAPFAEVGRLFGSFAEPGYEAQLAIFVRGELVVDLAAGLDPDALMTVYSSTKGLAAIAFGLLVDRGQLDLNAAVADYWPEFGQAGKDQVAVRELLSHQAGLPEVDGRVPTDAWLDDHRAAGLLAEQLPFWRPGAAFGYHAVSIGSLMSELCFRITGSTLQCFYEQEVRIPADADAYLGLPKELESRVVELLPMLEPTPDETAEFAAELTVKRGPYGPQVFSESVRDVFASPAGRAFGHPAGGGVTSARGLSKVYQWATGFGGPAGGVTSATLRAFAQTQVAGYDLVLDQAYRSHGLVFQKPTPAMLYGSYRAFGHDGAGGAMAFADPIHEICLGYTVRRVPFPGGMDRRLIPIIEAVHRASAECRLEPQ